MGDPSKDQGLRAGGQQMAGKLGAVGAREGTSTQGRAPGGSEAAITEGSRT